MTHNEQTNIRQRFGKAVRQRRRELDMSQEQLAELAELHRTYISDVETGKVSPSLDNIEKIAKALGISIVKLFARYKIEPELDK
ncbi:helix-turn-helix domain-containing protein [Trichocoleus desertorum AS-A10]|uniref:helix-turn-helix domain-containing protein n=1 Tax=Trichocoleus desertorum TaxID=1481672 RepID=UPI003296D01F